MLWGARMVIPLNLKGKVLYWLHNFHPWVSRVKAFARNFVWWPNVDRH